ncbi:hypothetical protein [Streptomyces sp. NPDC003697]
MGPFYASTSTRRRYRSRSGGSGCAFALAVSFALLPWVAAFQSRTVAGHVVGGIFAGLEVALVVAVIAARGKTKAAAQASGKLAPRTGKQEQVQKGFIDDLPPYLRPPCGEQRRRR